MFAHDVKHYGWRVALFNAAFLASARVLRWLDPSITKVSVR